MKALGWFLLALALFVATLVASFPASLAWQWWRPMDVPLALVDVRGSIWHGGAAQVHWRDRDLGSLTWTVRPSALLAGRLDAALRLSGPAVLTGRLSQGIDTSEFTDVRLDVPPQWLTDALMSQGLSAGGRVSVTLAQAVVKSGRISALSGALHWDDAVVNVGTAVSLGRLSAPFSLAGAQRVQGTIQDGGGPLSIRGTFEADPSHYRIRLTLGARAPGVRPLLDALGEPLPDGQRLLVIEQHIEPGSF